MQKIKTGWVQKFFWILHCLLSTLINGIEKTFEYKKFGYYKNVLNFLLSVPVHEIMIFEYFLFHGLVL